MKHVLLILEGFGRIDREMGEGKRCKTLAIYLLIAGIAFITGLGHAFRSVLLWGGPNDRSR